MARKLNRGSIRRAARPLRLYFAGQGLIVAGAWSIGATGSLIPMALASSAALMLTLPLLRHLLARPLAGAHAPSPTRRL